MTSYHRVLEAFGRSVSDNDVQCNLDIHPWDISIDGEQWSGKIRLIGYIDIFFLICYSHNSRIEKGIIIYKYQANVDRLRELSGFTSGLPAIEESNKGAVTPVTGDGGEAVEAVEAVEAASPVDDRKKKKKKEGKGTGTPLDQPGDCVFSKDSTFYQIIGRGHVIGLKLSYPDSVWRNYKIEIRKSGDPLKNRRIKRGIKKHDTLDLLEDSAKISIISTSEVVGHATGHMVMGGFMEDAGKKYAEGITSSQRSQRMTLSGDM